MESKSNFKKIALRAAKKAGKILEKNFRKATKIFFKKDSSLLTKVDLKSERAIVQLIKKNFPSHDILSEERGGKIGEKYTWIIDPLDGTRNYSRNIPFFSVSIALVYKKSPILGVVFNPINKELYFSERGKGAFLNGKRIKVGQQQVLSQAIISFSKSPDKEAFIKIYRILGKIKKFCFTFRFRYFGSTALDLCYIASAKTDVSIGTGLKPWDLAAGILIIREAGGKITNLEGRDCQIEEKNIITANVRLHNQLLKLI